MDERGREDVAVEAVEVTRDVVRLAWPFTVRQLSAYKHRGEQVNIHCRRNKVAASPDVSSSSYMASGRTFRTDANVPAIYNGSA